MSKSRDYLEMSAKAIEFFSEDGKLSAAGLKELMAIAERDGVIDGNEIRVLRGVISRLQPHEIDDAMRLKLEKIAARITPNQD